ncbi:calcium ATPase, partial [Ramicandelaber brevisporus]
MSHDEKKVEVEDHEHQEVEDKIPAELEELLHTDHTTGLTTDEAMRRLEQFGRNELPEKKTNPFLKFLSYFTGSIAFLIEVACILSAVVKDWINFGIILGLLFINAIIGFVEEARAE